SRESARDCPNRCARGDAPAARSEMIHQTAIILAEEMGDDEVFVVIVALVGAIATAVRLAWQVLPASKLGARTWTREVVLVMPVPALGLLYFVLTRWAAQDVR